MGVSGGNDKQEQQGGSVKAFDLDAATRAIIHQQSSIINVT
jgi:hypothetical protein